ncbi:hypothetical protein, partial [Salinibacter altiplanensis]|uniref:hypothetical protein n=1 Tax=Salinibacter altiplanensis TaxID=1803181 RepID=UPI001F4211BF
METDPSMAADLSRGVYFSANDAVYDWAVAFLNSYRQFNPNLPLFLIPFDEDCSRLLELQSEYDFETYTDSAFERLEGIGEAFELGHAEGVGPYWFRRYAAFWGPLDEFMYLDARQLVLADLEPFVTAPGEYGFDFMHYDCALDQVYEPGPFRREMLRQNRGRGFNSGRWASRKGLFSIDEFEDLAEEALEIRDQLNPRNTDQSFINYCCDVKPVQYGHFAEVMGNICQQGWANQPGSVYERDGGYYLWNYGGLDHKKCLVLLHWAGISEGPTMPEGSYFYEFLLKRRTATGKVSKHLSLALK